MGHRQHRLFTFLLLLLPPLLLRHADGGPGARWVGAWMAMGADLDGDEVFALMHPAFMPEIAPAAVRAEAGRGSARRRGRGRRGRKLPSGAHD